MDKLDIDQILVLSPHMDDIVLDCFDHIKKWKITSEVHVLTLFSAYPQNGLSVAAETYLSMSGYDNIQVFQKARYQEDEAAMKLLDVSFNRLDLPDAAFRKSCHNISLYPDYKTIFSGKIADDPSTFQTIISTLKTCPVTIM